MFKKENITMDKEIIKKLEPYNPEWSQNFILEKKKILSQFVEKGIMIEHIGSTSVKEMEAKPIIDIMIGLNDFEKSIKNTKYILGQNDYKEVKFSFDFGERCFFIKKNREGERIFTALIVKMNGRLWRKNLEIKKLLMSSQKEREKYIEFKKISIEENKGDREEYNRSKEKYFNSPKNK